MWGKRRLVQLLAVFRLCGAFVIGRRRYLQSGPNDGRRGRFRRYGWRAGDGRADDGGQRDDGSHHRPRRSVRRRRPPAARSCGCGGHGGARRAITSCGYLPRSVLINHTRRADAELQRNRKQSRLCIDIASGGLQWLRKNNDYWAGDVWQTTGVARLIE